MATSMLTYSGPEGFAIAGLGSLVPGEEYEVDASLKHHPWFGGKPEPEPEDAVEPPLSERAVKLSELPKTHKELDKIAAELGIEFPPDSIVATKQKLIKEAGA